MLQVVDQHLIIIQCHDGPTPRMAFRTWCLRTNCHFVVVLQLGFLFIPSIVLRIVVEDSFLVVLRYQPTQYLFCACWACCLVVLLVFIIKLLVIVLVLVLLLVCGQSNQIKYRSIISRRCLIRIRRWNPTQTCDGSIIHVANHYWWGHDTNQKKKDSSARGHSSLAS